MRGERHKETERRRKNQLQRARAAWLLASDLAADEFGADTRVVMKTRGTRGRGGVADVSLARKVACYLATVVANVAAEHLAIVSGVHRTTIYAHVEWVEEQREEGEAFDVKIDALETALVGMAARIVLARLGDPSEAAA